MLVEFLVGTGVRPEEAFGAEWRDVDLEGGIFTVRRAFAKGRLKELREDRALAPAGAAARADGRGARAAGAPPRDRVPEHGGRADRHQQLPPSRHWTPALEAAGVAHRRIYDLRHTYATWSLAAGVDIFTLSRRMGTSVAMIDRTYGHLAAGADEYERELLDAYDARSAAIGRCVGAGTSEAGSENG